MSLASSARIASAVLLALVVSLGCKPQIVAPEPLPVDQLAGALEKAFSSAPAQAKDMATEVAAAVRAQDYAKAQPQLQVLAGLPKLSKEQISVTTRGLVTLNEALQNAQAQGDQKAAQTLQNYRSTK